MWKHNLFASLIALLAVASPANAQMDDFYRAVDAGAFGPAQDLDYHGHGLWVMPAQIHRDHNHIDLAGAITHGLNFRQDDHVEYTAAIDDGKVTSLNIKYIENGFSKLLPPELIAAVATFVTDKPITPDQAKAAQDIAAKVGGADDWKSVTELLVAAIVQRVARTADVPLQNYHIITKTADIPDAGTDANVFVELIGSNDRRIVQLERDGNEREQGATDTYEFKYLPLGSITKINIWHDNSGNKPAWLCERLDVTNDTTNEHTMFGVGWLDKGKPTGVRRDGVGVAHEYSLIVRTEDVGDAGTDANVTIHLVGSNRSIDYALPNLKIDANERGHADNYPVVLWDDLGNLQSLDVWHDNSGRKAGWKCDSIEIDDHTTNHKWNFPVHQWIESGHLRVNGITPR